MEDLTDRDRVLAELRAHGWVKLIVARDGNTYGLTADTVFARDTAAYEGTIVPHTLAREALSHRLVGFDLRSL